MSRTYRGNRNNREYWGRRATGPGKWLMQPGPDTKKRTHRKERREGKVR